MIDEKDCEVFKDAMEVDRRLGRSLDPVSFATVPNDEYHKSRGISHSTLKKMSMSASKLRWELDNPSPPSRALELGTAIHSALLEPHLFDATYVKTPKFDRRTKQGKADSEAWEEENKGKVGLAPDDWAIVDRIRLRVENDEFYRQLIIPGLKEKSFWTFDREFDAWKRCRTDNIVETPYGLVIVDLKSTDCAAEHVFQHDITKYGYFTAASYYMDVVEEAIGERPSMYCIIAVEKSKDCDINAFCFKEEDLVKGRLIYRRWLSQLTTCYRTGNWPGYSRQFVEYRVPKYLDDVAAQLAEDDAGGLF